MTRQEVMAIAEFLGDDMTDEQAVKLMDEVRRLGEDDKYYLYDYLPGSKLYTLLSEHFGEMGL